MIEDDKLVGQGRDHRYLLLSVIIDDLLGQIRVVLLLIIQPDLLVDKAVQRRFQLPRLDERIVRGKSPVELDIVPMDLMVWIIQDRIVILCSTTNPTLATAFLIDRDRLHIHARDVAVQIKRIAKRSVVDGVVEALERLSSQEVVD